MGYALDKLRVLIVDQNTYIRELLRTILQNVGTGNIDLKSNSEDGFAACCCREYDVVFTDSELQPLSGLEFVDQIRQSPESPNPYVPIIMLSAHSDEDMVRLARDHGVTEFLAKPFTVDVILTRLESVIENPRPFIRTRTYFGPDRRRIESDDYTGPERRKSVLTQVNLSKQDISKQQKAALVKQKTNIDEMIDG